jgi:SAM-dependent methyltransferase
MIAMDPAVIRWDLRKGIPFADRTFDVVYHSHVLEHVDRDTAPIFLGECMRTLKEGGVIRIAVPDLELLSRLYLESLARIPNGGSSDEHARAAEAIFDQMIVRTPKVRREQKPIVRFAEALLIGNTDRAGVLHRWMYDRVSLAELLRSVGFVDVQRHTATSSSVSDWARFNLDTNPDGSIYKPDSFYMEARRP